jgi:hypothetical protein
MVRRGRRAPARSPRDVLGALDRAAPAGHAEAVGSTSWNSVAVPIGQTHVTWTGPEEAHPERLEKPTRANFEAT